MRPVISLTAGLLLITVTNLSTQQVPPVVPGDRVRVTAPDLGIHNQATTLKAWRGDTLVLAAGGRFAPRTLICPLASVTQLDMSRGRKSPGERGAWTGAMVLGIPSALVGAGLGAFAYGYADDDPAVGALVGFSLFGVAGATAGLIIGGIIGSVSGSERWEEIPLDRLRVRPAATPDGRFGLMGSIRF